MFGRYSSRDERHDQFGNRGIVNGLFGGFGISRPPVHDPPRVPTPPPPPPRVIVPAAMPVENRPLPPVPQAVEGAAPNPIPDNDDDKCKICFDVEMNTVFIPCGHIAACITCAQSCRACPICRGAIDNIVHTYKS